MASLAGLHDQLNELQSHWQCVQESARPVHRLKAAGATEPAPEQQPTRRIPKSQHRLEAAQAATSTRRHTTGVHQQHCRPSDFRERSLAARPCRMERQTLQEPCIPLMPRQSHRHTLVHQPVQASNGICQMPAGARQYQSDDTENQWGAAAMPDVLSSEPAVTPASVRKRRTRPQRRPQWQDVSVDLSAQPAAEAEASNGNVPSHADNSGPRDSPSPHLTGVSPASPSPTQFSLAFQSGGVQQPSLMRAQTPAAGAVSSAMLGDVVDHGLAQRLTQQLAQQLSHQQPHGQHLLDDQAQCVNQSQRMDQHQLSDQHQQQQQEQYDWHQQQLHQQQLQQQHDWHQHQQQQQRYYEGNQQQQQQQQQQQRYDRDQQQQSDQYQQLHQVQGAPLRGQHHALQHEYGEPRQQQSQANQLNAQGTTQQLDHWHHPADVHRARFQHQQQRQLQPVQARQAAPLQQQQHQQLHQHHIHTSYGVPQGQPLAPTDALNAVPASLPPLASCTSFVSIPEHHSVARTQLSEEPRDGEQLPMQYMRHPHGPAAPGGLHKLHRLLRPVRRSQTVHNMQLPPLAQEPSAPCLTHEVSQATGLQTRLPPLAASDAHTHVRRHTHDGAGVDACQHPAEHRRHSTGLQPLSQPDQQQRRHELPVLQPAMHMHQLPTPLQNGLTDTDDMQDVNLRLQQVRHCLKQNRADELPLAAEYANPSAPSMARAKGRREVGDGGFAGMRLSQVFTAAPSPQARHPPQAQHPQLCDTENNGGRQAALDPWQGQGLDDVLRPAPAIPAASRSSRQRQDSSDSWQGQGLDEVLRPAPPPQRRRRAPAAPRHSSHSYADYISELQHTGAVNGNRLALHAGRQTHVHQSHGIRLAAEPSHAVADHAYHFQQSQVLQQPGAEIMALLPTVTYTRRASQLKPGSKAVNPSESAQTECSICLDAFVLQEKLCRVKGCGHLFHQRCIQEWFATGDSRCPMCRYDPVSESWPQG